MTAVEVTWVPAILVYQRLPVQGSYEPCSTAMTAVDATWVPAILVYQQLPV